MKNIECCYEIDIFVTHTLLKGMQSHTIRECSPCMQNAWCSAADDRVTNAYLTYIANSPQNTPTEQEHAKIKITSLYSPVAHYLNT